MARVAHSLQQDKLTKEEKSDAGNHWKAFPGPAHAVRCGILNSLTLRNLIQTEKCWIAVNAPGLQYGRFLLVTT